MTQPIPYSSERIDYIDIIKGFTILWVVVFHLGSEMPGWLVSPLRLPLFYFLSGIFFRPRPFKQFITKRLNTLLIPFLIWYFISWVFIYLKYDVIGSMIGYSEDIQNTSITAILDLFNITNEDSLSPFGHNPPIWFLLSLFNIQLIYYAIRKLTTNKIYTLLVCIIAYLISLICGEYQINGVFFIPSALGNLLFYALGSLYGNNLVKLLTNKKTELIMVTAALALFIPLSIWSTQDMPNIITQLQLIARVILFTIIVFVFFKNTHNIAIFRPLNFYGRNSLVVLCTHTMIILTISPLITYFFKTFDRTLYWNNIIYSGALFLIICIITYILIKLFNKYTPWLVGKKDWIKYQ